MTVSALAIGAGIIGAGLIAGFFWGWSVSAGLGLARVSDHNYVSAMQSINQAILNPVFLLVFMGSTLVLAGAAVASFVAGDTRRGWWMASAAVVYAVGVFGVTAAGNVPLNNTLDAFDLAGGTDASIAEARHDYEGPWNRLHYIRSTLAVLVVGLASTAALTPSED